VSITWWVPCEVAFPDTKNNDEAGVFKIRVVKWQPRTIEL